jgi:phage N-6-adenine-methyltransferase
MPPDKAARYFTKADNGLEREWQGRVWLNPPYAQPLIMDFVSKMVVERKAGRVTGAVMLTNNSADTAWFHEAAQTADAFCLTRGRIKFYKTCGEMSAPTQGQTFFYFGDNVEAFTRRFKEIGFVVVPA